MYCKTDTDNGYFTWNIIITSKAIQVLDQLLKTQYI